MLLLVLYICIKEKATDILPKHIQWLIIAEKKKCSHHLFKENWCYGLLRFIMALLLVSEIQKKYQMNILDMILPCTGS